MAEATRQTQDMALSFGDPKQTVSGYILINTETGDTEWFRKGDDQPTFVSNADEKFKWRPRDDSSIPNLINKGLPLDGGNNDLESSSSDKDAFVDEIEAVMADSESSVVTSLNDQRVDLIGEFGTDKQKENLLSVDAEGNAKVPGAVDINAFASAIATLPIEGAVAIDDVNFAGLRYPVDIDPDEQDYISITIIEYGQKAFDLGAGGKIGFTSREFTTGNTIILPIQSSIRDQNMVQWADGKMNPLQVGAAGASSGMVNGEGGAVVDALKGVLKDQNVQDAVVTSLIAKAGNATGLLSRLSGSIANPNLELLFNGPQLRPFSLEFFMSPRSPAEAIVVKKIIRALKQAMAVKRATNGIFLKAPDVFRVKYNQAGGKEHASINRFKECAMTDMSVDYTPGGTYSTFNDADNTMTAYKMTLNFKELEPVFADEYKYDGGKYPIESSGSPGINEIGY